MTTLNNAVYLLAYVTIQAGELSYPMRRVTANIHGDVNTALNDLNSELKDEFLGVDGNTELACYEDRNDLEEWQKGFWHENVHTIRIVGYKEISKVQYDVMMSI